MRKLFAAILLLVLSSSSFATHGAHVEFHYYWKSDSTYVIRAVYFKNCTKFGLPNPPSSISLKVSSVSRSYNSSKLIRMDSASWLLNPTSIPFSCGNPDSTCREVYTYTGEWTSPGAASDWIFSSQICCRIGGISDYPPNGLENVEYVTYYTEFGINNLDFRDSQGKNVSPVWHNPLPSIPGHLTDTIIQYPVNSLCQKKQYNLNHGAAEYQGDSVVYSFYHPQTISGDTTPYRLGYSFTNPMSTINSPVAIDSQTGIVSLIPNVPKESGFCVLGIRADEYRNGKSLGFIKKEITLQITDSSLTGIDTYSKPYFKMYPNPTSGKVHIDFHANEDRQIQIYNSMGKLIFVKDLSSIETSCDIDLTSQNSGIYFINISNLKSGDIKTSRLVLSK